MGDKVMYGLHPTSSDLKYQNAKKGIRRDSQMGYTVSNDGVTIFDKERVYKLLIWRWSIHWLVYLDLAPKEI